jgi:hypothetical protein
MKGRFMGFFTAKPVLVVDGTALLRAKGIRGNAAPRQQLQILRSLSRTARRENLKITAVLTGKPLDKAPHNKTVDGVRARYAKKNEMLKKEMKKALNQVGCCGILVTEDTEFEKRIQRGGNNTLRISTFRKLLEDGGDNTPSGGNDGNSGDKKRFRNNRRDRKQRVENKSNSGKKKHSNADKRKNEEDAISQMIDLVD